MGPDVWQEYARNLANVVAPAVGDAGIQLWTGLSLIMLVWTGTQMALAGGGVNMASIVRLVIVLSIPFGMLRFYVLPMPGVGLSVPDIITGMGGWLQSVIIADAGEDMRQELAALTEQMWRNIALHAGGEDAGVFARIHAMLGALSTVLFGALLSILMVVLLVVVWAVGQGQVIWAQLAITLAILLGPIFIPFLVMPPLSFLFWGWFRTVLTYSLYAAVAAAIFRVTTQVGIQNARRGGRADGGVRDARRGAGDDGKSATDADVLGGGVDGLAQGRRVRTDAPIRGRRCLVLGRESCGANRSDGRTERGWLENGGTRVYGDLG